MESAISLPQNFNEALQTKNEKVKLISNQNQMNMSTNKVELTGNLGTNPEVKELNSGKKMAKLSLATHELRKNSTGERITETQWHNLIVWGRHAELAEQQLKKGSPVTIIGKINSRNYMDKNGNKRNVTEIQVSNIRILNPNPANPPYTGEILKRA